MPQSNKGRVFSCFREIREALWPGGEALVVLDELHKWRGWKRWIKGEFDKHRRRLRFLVTVGRKPWFAVEAKLRETRVDSALHYFGERIRIPWSYQVVLEGKRDFVQDGVRCLPAHRFLAALV